MWAHFCRRQNGSAYTGNGSLNDFGLFRRRRHVLAGQRETGQKAIEILSAGNVHLSMEDAAQ